MKMKKANRLVALLLSLLMLLGTLPTAFAESGTVVMDSEYDELLDAVVQSYYNELMACETYEEMLELFGNRNWDQFNAFLDELSDEYASALTTDMDMLYADYVERTSQPLMIKPVNVTRVARFLSPVSGTATVSTFALARSTAVMTAATDTNNNGLVTDKYISKTNDDGQYTLTLEAYATGTKTITTGKKDVPTDIILVLDQSGSMEYCIRCGKSLTAEDRQGNSYYTDCTYTAGYSATYSVSNNSEYYVQNSDGTFSRVYRCQGSSYYECSAGWYTEAHGDGSHGGDKLTYKTSADGDGTQFYTVQTETVEHEADDARLNALTTAVKGFVDAVEEKAEGADQTAGTNDDINHRIAVVGFASQSGYGNNTEILSIAGKNSGSVGVAYNDLDTDYYKIALQDMNSAAGQTMVDNAVEALAAQGATQSNLGMEMAENIFANNSIADGENRNRVVVMFTDGTPTKNNSWSTDVANGAISSAKKLKNTYGATVYTVGVFSGADGTRLPTNSTGLAAVSNENKYMHYCSSNFKNAESMDAPGTATYPDSGSYYLSASDSSALNSIFQQISDQIQNGGSSTTLNETAVVKDVLTEQFELPEGTGISDIKLYAAEYVNGTFEEREGWETIAATDETVSISGRTIEVTGFDFAENWVGTETTDGVTAYRGKKLIIEIPIEVRDGFLGGNGVLTNADGSGVYENASAEEALDKFVSPTVDVAIGEVTVTAPDKNVYLLGGVTEVELEAALTVKVGDVALDMGAENYGLAEWQYAYVNLSEEDGTENYSALTEDKSYTVSVTVTPKTVGTATKKESGDVTGHINVFKPVLTFQDTVRDYMADVTGYDYDKENLVSTEWMHGTTKADETIMGTAPTLTLTYDKAESTWITNNKVTGLNDVAVNVTAAIGGTDVTAYTTSYRNKCDDSECNYAGGNGATAEFNPEFIVHIRNIYGALKVSKTVPEVTGDVAQPNAADEFTFTVTFGDGVAYTYDKYDATGMIAENLTGELKLKAGEYALYEEVPAETAYTVVETDDTTDYYTPTETTKTGAIVAATTVEAAFTNTYTKLNGGNLTITKVVKDSTFTEGSKEFSFTVELNSKDAVALKQFGEAMAAEGYTAANGKVTVTITVNATDANKTNSLELNDLPVGSYTVTEAAAAGYNTTYDVQEVTVTKDGNVTVTVTNTATGTIDSIPVSKVWEDSNDTWKLRPTSVTAKLVGTKPDGTDYEHALGTKTLSSTNDWADAWTNVPMFDAEGNLITYTVDEEAVAGYTKSIEGNVITNTLNIGSLTIEKKNMQADESAIFDVEVTTGTETKVWTVVLNKNNNYTATLVGLPDGAAYKVSENEAWSWSYSLDAEKTTGAKGAIEAGEVKVASFENTKNEQWLYDESSAVNKFVGTNN